VAVTVTATYAVWCAVGWMWCRQQCVSSAGDQPPVVRVCL
jgi:hypothetical protein